MVRLKKIDFLLIVFIIFIVLPSVSASHFIVGIVNDAYDGESANGKTIVLWNPTNGIEDNLTDTIGPTGNSGANNIYMIDCELLQTSCSVGDEIKTKVIRDGGNYITSDANTSVTGAGYDIMPSLRLNSPTIITSISIDDEFDTPSGEIDLNPAETKEVACEGVVFKYGGDQNISNATAEFFDNSASFYGDTDDKNHHYSNDSCSLNYEYGDENETYFNCTFQIEYYSNNEDWNCTIAAKDNLSISGQGSNLSYINSLLALNIPSPTDFGEINASNVGVESIINVTNAGNVMINLSLSGYAVNVDDGYAMNCTRGEVQNISIEYAKYNLTESNSGIINSLADFETNYTNLTSNVVINKFNLDYRRNDTSAFIDDTNSTYWRVYVPIGVAGSCSGNIVFGAVRS